MALIAGGLIDVNGDLIDTVRSVTCAAEAGVGAGATISDGGESRFIAETAASAASGERIDMGAIAYDASFTWVVRFVFRTGDGGTGNYEALISRGGTFENNTQASVGWRGTSLAPFQYQRNVAALVGSEASGQPSLTAGAAYTLIYRVTSGSKQMYYCAEDIGGAGVDFVLVTSSTDALGTDGSQNIYLGGPNTFTDQDRSINAGILGALIYDHRVDDTELAAIALDGATGFYAQLVPPDPPVGPIVATPIGPTNGSGVATGALTSDTALDGTPGALLLVTLTVGGVTLRTTALPDATP